MQVKEAIGSPDFKPNCAMVALDFLIRHSYIQPDEGRQCRTSKRIYSMVKGGGATNRTGHVCANILIDTIYIQSNLNFLLILFLSELHYVELVEGLHRTL